MHHSAKKSQKRKLFVYDRGVKAGDRVRLKKGFTVKGTNDVHTPGEIWRVLRGVDKHPRILIKMRQPDGRIHGWLDRPDFWDTFEVII
jgi:hypothetical protein